jgi:hypothetical protein
VASRAETSVVYAAGVAQGIALVTFPAVSTVLTDPDEYHLSKTQYVTLFLPQVPRRRHQTTHSDGGRPGRGRWPRQYPGLRRKRWTPTT